MNNLQTGNPNLAKEWHPLLNGALQPSEVLPGSNRKVAWLCSKCGYVWEAKICNRAKLGRGCPCCSNKVTVKVRINYLTPEDHTKLPSSAQNISMTAHFDYTQVS